MYTKFHYYVHKNPPVIPILSQLNSVHTLSSCVSNVYSVIVLASMPTSSKWAISFRFTHQNSAYIYIYLFSPICAACPAPLILHLITQIIFGEKYKSWRSSMCNFSSPLLLHHAWAKIHPLTPYSLTPSAQGFSLTQETKFHMHIKQAKW